MTCSLLKLPQLDSAYRGNLLHEKLKSERVALPQIYQQMNIKNSLALFVRSTGKMVALTFMISILETMVLVASIVASAISIIAFVIIGAVTYLIAETLSLLLFFIPTASDIISLIADLIVLSLLVLFPLILAFIFIAFLIPEDEGPYTLPYDTELFVIPSIWFLPLITAVIIRPSLVSPPWDGLALVFIGGLVGAVLFRSLLYGSLHHKRQRDVSSIKSGNKRWGPKNFLGQFLSRVINPAWYLIVFYFGIFILFLGLQFLIISLIPADTNPFIEAFADLPMTPTTIRGLLLIPVGAAGTLAGPWAVSGGVGSCVFVYYHAKRPVLRVAHLLKLVGIESFKVARFIILRYVLLRP